ncbi:glycosyl hydrolase family 8 [Leptothermofonsia sp. ETS-13]|uniref:glycosyl hydrolase family 8 n=1 Tax=Leptothermofonsia sp. ETS-13 TaxID=3035696 RepID=UPI003BA39532
MGKSIQAQQLFGVLLLLNLTGCYSLQLPKMTLFVNQPGGQIPDYCPGQSPSSAQEVADLKLPQANAVLQQSWLAFQDRFIQTDGRTIDREVSDQTTSAGQAYAMLRAVLINDHEAFARVLTWGENNLSRKDAKGQRIDHLWAWSWGQTEQKEWRILDPKFVSGAEVDVATALIMASRRWNCARYLAIARAKLDDLWKLSTEIVKGRRYFLSTSDSVFWSKPNTLLLNPSNFAPYAFRLFAQVDAKHDWLSLVESSYQILNKSAKVSEVGLPSDWILLDSTTGEISPVSTYGPQQSLYGFDAARVWWRIALDAAWFQSRQAKQYLKQHTAYLKQLWKANQRISAQIDLQGKPLVDFETTSQYAMLYAALRQTDPEIANQIYQMKLKRQYKEGFWDNDSAYSTQNMVWLGLLAPKPPTPLLKP